MSDSDTPTDPCGLADLADPGPCDGPRDAVRLDPHGTGCPAHAAALMATTSGWWAWPGPGDPSGWWAATARSWASGVDSVWVPSPPGVVL